MGYRNSYNYVSLSLKFENHFIQMFIKEHTSNYFNMEGILCGFTTVHCVCDASVTAPGF